MLVLELTSGSSVCLCVSAARGSTVRLILNFIFPGATICHGPGPACARPGERLRGSSLHFSPHHYHSHRSNTRAGQGWAPLDILVSAGLPDKLFISFVLRTRAVAQTSLGDCSRKKNCIKRVRKERFKDKW